MTHRKKITLFKVRTRTHEEVGNLSAQEILYRIKKGELTGEEDIAVSPFIEWEKLASHPEFYDAFLKKIFNESYQPPDRGIEAPKSGHGKTSEELTKVKNRDSEKKHPRNKDSLNKVPPGTFNEQLIHELFEDSMGEEENEGTDVLKLDALGPENPALSKNKIVPVSEELLESEGANVKMSGLQRFLKNRKGLFYGGVGVLLVILYWINSSSLPLIHREDSIQPSDVNSSLITAELRNEKKKSLLDEGDSLFAFDIGLAYKAAQSVYGEALRLDENDPQILGRIAYSAVRALQEEGGSGTGAQGSEIRSLVAQGRRKDPHFSTFYRVESILANQSGKSDVAKQLLEKAMETDPTDSENLIAGAEIFFGGGSIEEAIKMLERAVELAPTSVRGNSLLAKALIKTTKPTLAKGRATAALQYNPLHANSYCYLAELEDAQNQQREAKSLYEACAKLAPFASKENAAKAFYRLGEHYETLENKSLAQRNYLLARYYYKDLPGLDSKLKGIEKSDEYIKKLENETVYSKDYFLEQAEQHFKEGKFVEASKYYQAATLLQPENGSILVRLGESIEKIASSYEEFRRVMNLYERAIERNPDLSEAYLQLGELETSQYNFDRGYKLLNQADTLSPKESRVSVALGKHFFMSKDIDKSEHYLQEALKRDPNSSEAMYYVGMNRLQGPKRDAIEQAAAQFYAAYTLDPQNYDALSEWLKLRVLNIEKNFAVRFTKNLIQSDPTNYQYYWVLGEIYAANTEFKRAIRYYHNALDINNRASKVRFSLAKALEAIGEIPKAVIEYRLAAELDRRNSEGFFRAAELLFEAQRYKDAEEILKTLIGIFPNYPGAYQNLARIYQIKEQRDKAVEAMQREVANHPRNAKYRLELAEVYMGYERYEEAIRELKVIINLPPIEQAPAFIHDKIRAYLLLSRTYRAQNKPQSAEGAMMLALAIDNNDPQLHRELGYVYFDLQRDKEAVKEFEFYLSREPAARDKTTIEGLIERLRIEE